MSQGDGLSRLDYHVLLSMAEGPQYGYAIKEAVEVESGGALSPRAGTLYRVIARLISDGLVEEAATPAATEPHPGRPRRYYGLTSEGRSRLSAEATRMHDAAALARRRLGKV